MTDNTFSGLDIASYLREFLRDKQKAACPLINAPLKDCYCTGSNSQLIGQAVFYCGNNYTQCGTYKKNIQQP